MKTVWNVLSDNEIMDYPCVQTFESEKDALKMVDELFTMYQGDPAVITVENIADGKYFRFTGGEYEEWVYVMESEIYPATYSPVLDRDAL